MATATRHYSGQRPRTEYGITEQGPEELRRWLDRPPATRSVEFEGMVRLFFADAGSLVQLTATLTAIERDAAERLAELAEVNTQNLAGNNRFPQRLHLSVLALRLYVEQEIVVHSWARWARTRTAAWCSTRNPGAWRMVRWSANSRSSPGPRCSRIGPGLRDHVAQAHTVGLAD